MTEKELLISISNRIEYMFKLLDDMKKQLIEIDSLLRSKYNEEDYRPNTFSA